MFCVTQDVRTYSCLKTYYAKIKDHFDINWVTVKWKDLRKPLHSCLAARLYLETVMAPIPDLFDFESQALYWEKHCNTNRRRSKETFKKALTTIAKEGKNPTHSV